jgi:hypothetical protein
MQAIWGEVKWLNGALIFQAAKKRKSRKKGSDQMKVLFILETAMKLRIL